MQGLYGVLKLGLASVPPLVYGDPFFFPAFLTLLVYAANLRAVGAKEL